jgi:hypothetical protein
MSTRCQVQVVGGDPDSYPEDKVTLYHHCDGYPDGMIPLIAEAFKKRGGDWRGGRVGHVAAFLIEQDVEGYEPEAGHQFHGDIEYYYRVHVMNPEGMHIGSRPRWEIEAWAVGYDEGSEKDPGRLILPRTEIREAATEEMRVKINLKDAEDDE